MKEDSFDSEHCWDPWDPAKTIPEQTENDSMQYAHTEPNFKMVKKVVKTIDRYDACGKSMGTEVISEYIYDVEQIELTRKTYNTFDNVVTQLNS